MPTPPEYFDAIHASPPCTHYSIARTCSKTPRDLDGADRLVERTLDIIEYFRPAVWIIENPYTGLMKSRPCMAGMDRYLRTVCYCRYGMQYKKATAVWTNLGGYWVERPMCSYSNPCEKVVNGRHPTTAQQRDGFSTKQLYALPKELCDELAISTTRVVEY
jgi:rhodanese-related sulfurtransferase